MGNVVKTFDAIAAELVRQSELKRAGRFPHTCADKIPNTARLAILAEEFGEVARATVEVERLANDTHNEGIKAQLAALRKELIQVAAVCCSWVEGVDNQLWMLGWEQQTIPTEIDGLKLPCPCGCLVASEAGMVRRMAIVPKVKGRYSHTCPGCAASYVVDVAEAIQTDLGPTWGVSWFPAVQSVQS